MEQGGVVAWGIVPAEYKIFASETPETLYQKYLGYQEPALFEYARRSFLMHSP